MRGRKAARQNFFRVAEISMSASAPAHNPLEDIVRKLVACVRLLSSDKEGERESAIAGVQRLLKGADSNTTCALADRLENGGLTEDYKRQVRDAIGSARAAAYAEGVRAAEARFRPDGKLTFADVALYTQRQIHRIPSDKHEFINKMALYANAELEPSPKQGKFLFDLFVQYLGGRIT
jgi:hypothetical protein